MGKGMKREFTLTIDGVVYPVVAEGDTIIVDGRPFTVEVAEDGSVLVDGIAYEAVLEGEKATVGGESHTVQVSGLALAPVTPLPAVAPAAPAAAQAGTGAVLAIMPGKIVRVLVEPGQQVEEGTPVCVLEAMKMENELRASRAGCVRAVHVKAGDDVQKDQVLVEIEQ